MVAGAAPDDLNRQFGNVATELEALGFHDTASRIVGIQSAALTTGPEWLGELGAAVKGIRSE